MPLLARLFLALILFLPLTPAMAQSQAVHPFAHQGVKEDGGRYEAYLKANWKLSTRNAAELRRDGERLLRTDPRAASRSFAGAVVADGRDADAWIGLSRALLAVAPDPNKDSERYDLPVNASGAAYIAYERAAGDPQKARALAVLGDALQRRSYWRPAIDALKTSLALADNGAVRETYDKLRSEHGFRMTDYKAEAEMAAPRLCLQFSEALARGQVDFAKFVSVDGKDPQSVSAENEQLCIDGLSHGQRYQVQVRAGLPSAVEEDLTKNIEIAVVCARPQAVRALLRQVLRAAEPWPAGHPAGFDQHRQGRGRGLPHRRPQPRRRARERRFPAPVAELRAGADQVALRREDLHRLHGRAAEAERGNHHGAPRHRRGRHAEARRLRHDRQAVAEVARGLQYRGDAVVHRLRPRPHRLLRR